MSDESAYDEVRFGDADPEDAWDDGDDDPTKFDVLERVVDDLNDCDDDERREARRVDALRLVDKMEHAPQGRSDAGRLADIRDDLETL